MQHGAGSTPVVPRLRSGELSSLELTERCLAQIEALDPVLTSFITVLADEAREAAAAADAARQDGAALGPLHGLPIALKDNIDTAGVRTTAGSAFFADRVPERDATVASRLRGAGAIVVGKVALHEFAFGATTQNPHHGLCRNPWNTDRIPGGSSGGSGAAVGADLVPAALGTDTGGSVRIPASLNGVTGLRPTTGRVPNTGVFPVSWSFDTVGPLARCVEDVAAVHAVIAGYDGDDPSSVDAPVEDPLAGLDRGVEGLRVGLATGFFVEGVEPEIVAGTRAVAELLARLGAEVHEVEIERATEAFEACGTMIRGDALAVHRERFATSPELFGEDVRRRLEAARAATAADYSLAREEGRAFRRHLDRVFASCDAILAPTSCIGAPDAGGDMIETTHRLTRLTYAWSMAALPALSLPAGLTAEGLPFGVQVATDSWREALLLRIGAAVQRETDWHLRRPPLLAAAAL